MRSIIYAALDDTGEKPDLDTALFDRAVDADISKCHEQADDLDGAGADASWNDYTPAAMVNVPRAHFEADRLCWGGRRFTAYELVTGLAGGDPSLTIERYVAAE